MNLQLFTVRDTAVYQLSIFRHYFMRIEIVAFMPGIECDDWTDLQKQTDLPHKIRKIC